jgi:hypothetical protein
MRGVVGFALFCLASLAGSAHAAEAPVRGFDAPPPTLNLTEPDHVFVAGLKPDEALSGPARSAATAGPTCSGAALRFGGCTQPEGAASGLLSGRPYASNPTGAGGVAGGILALEGLAVLLKDD